MQTVLTCLCVEESMQQRQQLSQEAGPSGTLAFQLGADDDVIDEDEEPPFPEAPERAMYLSDLLGLAAEVEAAKLIEENYEDVFITGISEDCSATLPGDLYCCIERVRAFDITDGHDVEHVQAAIDAGAAAILAQEGNELAVQVPDHIPVIYADDTDELSARLAAVFYDSPGPPMNTVAVAGTSGKTTVSWLVRGVLEQAGQLTGMIGSIEHALAEHLLTPEGDFWKAAEADPAAERECASPFALVPYRGRYLVEETTPYSLQMQKLLASMRDHGATAAVVECTADGIAAGGTRFLQPDIAVFTNLTEHPQEQELLGCREEYVSNTLHLFQNLQDPDKQRAVLNLDDPNYRLVAEACSVVPQLTYAIANTSADVHVDAVEFQLWQTTMIVATPVGRLEIVTDMVGRHNVYNILAAIAVGVLLNIPLADIGAGIESVQIVPGRCEVVNNILNLENATEAEELQNKLPRDYPVVVDAADTPERLATVLESLREAGASRVFTVFGCDGMSTSGEVRARMGEVAHQRSEVVIVTNSSPRLEDPGDIIQDIIAGWPNEIFEPYAAYVYNVFQDQTRAPLWFEPFLHSAQRRWKRHIMEDRFQAIRAAIGTAAPGDVVLLAGRGHLDYIEHWDGEDGVVRGWFDDRVEARNALSKLQYLYALVDLDRSALPWGPPPDDAKSVVLEIE
eukprot:GHRR01019886.1.p1 GENE.GHRR01019886.1~~GHRR01019886.1.p1  ORF type:complete len:681 (+),score=219.20 GHRR01019886.1:600-2642(+)